DRAYAVGAGGGLWTWTSESGSWEPIFSTAASPLNAIAFSTSEPTRGFAVGSPNILRPNQPDRFGADLRTMPKPPPPDTPPVFPSVAFAGNEAIATYHLANVENHDQSGGVAVEGGSGWKPEPKVAQMLAGLPGDQRWPTKAAGLPD